MADPNSPEEMAKALMANSMPEGKANPSNYLNPMGKPSFQPNGLSAANGNTGGQLPTPWALSPQEFAKRSQKVLTDHPEFRQVPFGVSNEFVQNLSYDDYVKFRNGEPLISKIK